jgi:hypothetical protein
MHPTHSNFNLARRIDLTVVEGNSQTPKQRRVLGKFRSPRMLWTGQLRCTCNLALAGATARVRRDRAGGAAGVATALGHRPNRIYANRADCALGHAVGANRNRGSSLVLIADAPISRKQFLRRGLLVEVTRGGERDWAALSICGRGAEAYRLQHTRRRAARQGNHDSDNSKEQNGKAVLSHPDPLGLRARNSGCPLSIVSKHSRIARDATNACRPLRVADPRS